MAKKSKAVHQTDVEHAKPISRMEEISKVDPILAALFDSSLSTHKPLSRSTPSKHTPQSRSDLSSSDSDEAIALDEDAPKVDAEDTITPLRSRKRKRKVVETEIEDAYLHRLEVEQAREDAKRRKSDKEEKGIQHGGEMNKKDTEGDGSGSSLHGHDTDDDVENGFEVPQHETVAPSKDTTEIEKASRTVFLGNVSTAAIKSKSSRKILLGHLASFFTELSDQESQHKVESLRFRSTAFATAAVPKKAAFAKKELMDATTRSTNAYAVYSTALATREAVKRLNGTIVLDRHLRIDSIAHPSKVDHRRCVFVGNLGFVDDESNIKAAEEQEDGAKKPKKSKPPSDIEEGLWRQFEKAGSVESVRVVRDKTTRVGKGIAYVQFKEPNSVEKALSFDGKKFPPLLPRSLRVTRAKSITKTSSYAMKDRSGPKTSREAIYQPKRSTHSQSLAGRAGKLFGRAGAAHIRSRDGEGSRKRHKSVGSVAKTPESIVFEGHRARGDQGKGTLKLGKSGKKTDKSKIKRTKRSTVFKAGKSKKGRT